MEPTALAQTEAADFIAHFPKCLESHVKNRPRISDAERALLVKHRGFYEGLSTGQVVPRTEAQHHFAQVCLGESCPNTEHEIAFVKFMGLLRWNRRNGICTICKKPIPTPVLIDHPGQSVCPGCTAKRERGEKKVELRTSSNPARKVGSLPRSGPNAGYRYSGLGPDGNHPGSGVFENRGGFADYDYDKVSPHNIPRKKKK